MFTDYFLMISTDSTSVSNTETQSSKLSGPERNYFLRTKTWLSLIPMAARESVLVKGSGIASLIPL